jgi:hypothetical protein
MNLARIWKDNDDLEIRPSMYKTPPTTFTMSWAQVPTLDAAQLG